MTRGSGVGHPAWLLAVLLLLAPAEVRAEEALGAESLPELVSEAQVALRERDLPGITRLLVVSNRTMMALSCFLAALQSTPAAAQWLTQPGTDPEGLARLADEDADVAALKLIFERRGLGHLFGTAPDPWDEPLASADQELVLQRLQASVGRDPVGLVEDLHHYLERFRAPDGSGPLDELLQTLPQGEFGHLEVLTGPGGITEGSVQTGDATVYFVREGDRWLMRIWDVEIRAADPE